MNQITEINHLPTYSVTEAAKYVRLSVGTLRSWVYGSYYPTAAGQRYFSPLIKLPNSTTKQLSFTNLIESHVLSAIRRNYQISLVKIRVALDYIYQKFNHNHPLASLEFQTDGIDLFIQQFDDLIKVSNHGQMVMKEVLQTFLSRIERDEQGYPLRLFPFTRNLDIKDPRTVVIDPRISFGRMILVGTGIPTAILAERYKAGDSIDELAEDYQCDRLQIEEGIRCELTLIA